MKTVEKEAQIEYEEKKSKFIGYIKPVSTVDEAEKFIKKIKEYHPNATHNVPLYRVIENGQEYFKYNDDGEPSNTAGKPMAEILNILNVYNVALVATRYFGGIKLGAGGLIRNYAKTAKLVINEAGIVEYIEKKIALINFDYNKQGEIESIIERNNIEILDRDYNEKIMLKLKASELELNKIKDVQGIIVIEI